MLKKIYNDVYNIAKRIKEIDRYYYLVLNTSKNKFEVHNSNQQGSTYCLTLPFNELDERTLNYINKTKSCNIEKILNEIENNNKVRESAEKHGALSELYYNIEDLRR